MIKIGSIWKMCSFLLSITLLLPLCLISPVSAADANSFDVFTDFETGSINPFTNSPRTFQGTSALYYNGTGSVNRTTTFTLSNKIVGGVINMHFDWFAGRVKNSFKDDPNLAAINSGIMSIQDGAAKTKIFSIVFADTDIETNHLRYFVGDYGSSTAASPPQGTSLQNVTALDRWYTLDITFNFVKNEISFTITDRDDPSKFQVVEGVPMSEAYPAEPNIKSIFINGLRTSGNNIDITSAIDNFGYKVIDPNLPMYGVVGLRVDGLEKVEAGEAIMLYPRFSPGNALDKSITWESSDLSVATVAVDSKNRVIVTGVSDGTAIIKATSNNNAAVVVEKAIKVGALGNPVRKVEKLDRGLVAVATGNGVFMSWRLLGTDPSDISFNLYKNSEKAPVNQVPLGPANTDFVDPTGSAADTYSVAVLIGGREIYRSDPVIVWGQQYQSIPVQRPSGRMPDTGAAYNSYSIYDGTTADLDGDGENEIVFIWTPSNTKDNSQDGVTANVFLDAYKLDGTKLWGDGKWIDLGPNIRAGAHYTQMMVYDFDGDGKAEIIVKTADGTKDTFGTVIGKEGVYYGNSSGYILEGDEYLSVFEGATGKLLNSIPYNPPRGTVEDWGDSVGNRVDRFLASVAYLDGVHPSAVFTRGYYTRSCLWAVDWDGKQLTERWFFDSKVWGMQYEGQGNHNISVADVDNDGCDEIIFGSMTINNDGSPMYSTGLGHGDALHVGKFDPSRPGLQIMSVHESPSPYGLEMHDAMTGDIIWGAISTFDTGRGVTASIDPEYLGAQSWSNGGKDGSTTEGLGTYAADGTKLGRSINESITNAIYWDGDTGNELFDGQPPYDSGSPMINKPVPAPGTNGALRNYTNQRIFDFTGATTNGYWKYNPCLQADLLGDWREEVVLRSQDDTELRIYTTVTPTVHDGPGAVPESGIPTLMHDSVYRMAIAWQNVAYNQPPHTGFYLGYNMSDVKRMGGETVTVTFDSHGGSDTSPVAAEYGRLIDRQEDPEKAGYIFSGWYKDVELAEAWDFDVDVITGDITLYAKWTAVYVVSAVPSASVKKIPGNMNNLTVTVTELVSNGEKNVISETFSIHNNAADTYKVGPYKVFVDTKGSDQIRECYIVP